MIDRQARWPNLASPLVGALLIVGGCGGNTVADALGPNSVEADRLGALLGESASIPPEQVYRASVIVVGAFYRPQFSDHHEWGEDLLAFEMFEVEEAIRGQVAVDQIYVDLGGLDPAGAGSRLQIEQRYVVLLAPTARSAVLLADPATVWNLTTIIDQQLSTAEVIAVVEIGASAH